MSVKNIVIISSSPRMGGNSDVLCDELWRGAQDAGHNVEKVFLADKKIKYCTGCGDCIGTDAPCSIHDDMAHIIDLLLDADIIVLATPIYCYTMSGQLKTFIDRLCPVYSKLANKQFYYILTQLDTAENAPLITLSEFKAFVHCLPNAQEMNALLAQGIHKKGEVYDTEYPQVAYSLGYNMGNYDEEPETEN